VEHKQTIVLRKDLNMRKGKFDYQKSPAALLIRRPKGVTFGRL